MRCLQINISLQICIRYFANDTTATTTTTTTTTTNTTTTTTTTTTSTILCERRERVTTFQTQTTYTIKLAFNFVHNSHH
ncbi:unnamed protein product [Schistosoma margrebowiei]|uniref:Uncharacterized protein n=1 Tax=Schistosoma margrebowiei TaxID=48269 RepID=A0A183N679_9TREM|nr:unnamed protein product [Schistosoma margrebowiei]